MKNSRQLVLIDGVMKEFGKTPFPSRPPQDIVVQPSGLTPLTTPGRKCAHGVYIPANSEDPNRAEYCSECYPYDIFVKPHSVYKA